MADIADLLAQAFGIGASGGERLRGGGQFAGGLPLRPGLTGDQRLGGLRFRRRCIGRRHRVAPTGIERPRLRHPDRIGQFAVARGDPRLPPERCGAGILFVRHLAQPVEIGFGRAQLALGIPAPNVQPGDAGRFLQHRAAFGGAGGDDRADAVLADQRGRMRAGRGVGEQQRHVLGPHVAPVDAIGGTGTAFDPADDLDLVAIRVFGKDRDLGEVALRAGGGAGEDDVVHAGTAQRFRAVLTHGPAQRFEQVRLAAAIGADHAGQPGLDHQIGGIDEALEPAEPQPPERQPRRAGDGRVIRRGHGVRRRRPSAPLRSVAS